MRGEDISRMQSFEEVYVDIAGLSDKELDGHIAMLRKTAQYFSRGTLYGGSTVGTLGIAEIIALIHVATAEKNSRASSRLAKLAIGIALVGVFIAAAGMWR